MYEMKNYMMIKIKTQAHSLVTLTGNNAPVLLSQNLGPTSPMAATTFKDDLLIFSILRIFQILGPN